MASSYCYWDYSFYQNNLVLQFSYINFSNTSTQHTEGLLHSQSTNISSIHSSSLSFAFSISLSFSFILFYFWLMFWRGHPQLLKTFACQYLNSFESLCFLIWVSIVFALDHSWSRSNILFPLFFSLFFCQVLSFTNPLTDKTPSGFWFFFSFFACFNRFKLMGFLLMMQIHFVSYQVSFLMAFHFFLLHVISHYLFVLAVTGVLLDYGLIS